MLKLEFEDARDWVKLLDAIRDIVEETTFIATSEGLTLRAMDSARVAMIDLKLPSIFFSDYSIESEEVKIAFSIVDIYKTIRNIKKGYRLVLSLSEENLLRLTFVGKGTHIFEFPLLDITAEALPSLKVKLDAKIKIETSILESAIKNLEKFSDYATFKANNEKFIIYGKSEKGRSVSEFTKDDLINLEVEKESFSSYSTDYLLNMLGRKDLSEVTSLEFGTKNPLKVTYNLINEGELTYYLAPRTEVE